jgi:Flp pilus assembly pilin Flp
MSFIHLVRSARDFCAAENGVSAIEYALIAGAMGLATAAGASLLGPAVTSNFQLVADSF